MFFLFLGVFSYSLMSANDAYTINKSEVMLKHLHLDPLCYYVLYSELVVLTKTSNPWNKFSGKLLNLLFPGATGSTRVFPSTRTTPLDIQSRVNWCALFGVSENPPDISRLRLCAIQLKCCTVWKDPQHESHLISSNTIRFFYFNQLSLMCNPLLPLDLDQAPTALKSELRKHLWNHHLMRFQWPNSTHLSFVCPCSRGYAAPHPILPFFLIHLSLCIPLVCWQLRYTGSFTKTGYM